jgi:biotin carboxylase
MPDRDRPTAVVLGGTFPHIRLLHNLRFRGYRTVLIDYHEAPCAAGHADLHVRASTLDRDAVLRIATAETASLVISSCVDQANLIACSVAETLGLPRPYDSRKATLVTNKALMKTAMQDAGIPTSRFVTASAGAPPDVTDLRYPLIVKPTDSNSSKGIIKVESPTQLAGAIAIATNLSRTGTSIVEEYVSGKEVGLDFYVRGREPIPLITKDRRKIPLTACSAQQIFGCYWPAQLSPALVAEATAIASRIVDALELRDSPLMIQAILSANGLSVIEFAARFGGGESVAVIAAATGVDITDLSIRSFLHEPVSLTPKAPSKLYAETFLYSRECTFGRIVVDSSLRESTTIDGLHVYKTPGMAVGAELTSNNRVGCFIVSAETFTDLRRKIDSAVAAIDVLDMNGMSTFCRDLYEHDTDG